MNEQVELKGTIDSVIYQNPENGYSVFSLKTGEEDRTTCIAYMPKIQEGETVEVSGSYVTHPIYGKQLSVAKYEKTMPTSAEAMEKYLGSGVIKGVGEKMAGRIVKKFGQKTLKVIEESPEKLAAIKGISLEKALVIGAVFREQSELRTTVMFLQEFGISPVYAIKIFNKYKEGTIQKIKTNPYELADEIWGIGFKTADRIAFKVGIDQDSPYRIRAGIKYALNQAASNGHVYLPKTALLYETGELLLIPEEVIENNLIQLQIQKDIWQENIDGQTCVFLNYYYHAEAYVARKLVELSKGVVEKGGNIDFAKLESKLDITLAEKQKEAVAEAMNRGVLVITGGPGTGKTTTIKTIISLFKDEGLEIELAAPTGRAAKRMSEATGMEAKTIHRLLGVKFISEENSRQVFEKDEDTPLEAGAVVIDEASMIDLMLMNSLLKAIPAGTRLIIIGDVDQLPSVGAGNVLRDIIFSGVIKTVRLTEIFRQAQQSAIVMNAHRINNGEYPVLKNNKDFFFMRRELLNRVAEAIVELVTARLPAYAGYDPIRDMQVLTPMRKSELGVRELNNVLQRALNPESPDKKEKEFRGFVFREGDKVMQIKNNYNITWKAYGEKREIIEDGLGVFNGDDGIIKKITEENIYVVFDDSKEVAYDYSQLEELELAYAVTIHKSQGCEYKAVILPLHSGPPMLMSRNLLYTAVTRAKELAVIVGLPETVNRMVDNRREINRYSSLDGRIKKMHEFINFS